MTTYTKKLHAEAALLKAIAERLEKNSDTALDDAIEHVHSAIADIEFVTEACEEDDE